MLSLCNLRSVGAARRAPSSRGSKVCWKRGLSAHGHSHDEHTKKSAAADGGSDTNRTTKRSSSSYKPIKFNLNEPIRWSQGKEEFEEANGVLNKIVTMASFQRSLPVSIVSKDFWTWNTLAQHLMPRDYKNTTVGSYENYAKTTMLSSALGTAASILSTQALLTSVGVSSQSVLPIAATLNWVLKDGLGQLGGVIFASVVNTRFDADPKRFRFGADAALALSVILESSTALLPWLFLPLASIANVGKNAAWLSASATRASIHQSFCLEHNLADVTGKAGSQTITASLIGTAAGILVTPFLGNQPVNLMIATVCFSALHLVASYSALHFVQLKQLNIQRAWLCLSPALRSFRFQEAQSNLCALDLDKLDIPDNVARKERIVHFGKWGRQDGKAFLASPPSQMHDEEGFMGFLKSSIAPQPYLKHSLHVNPPLGNDLTVDTMRHMLHTCDAFEDQHLIRVAPDASAAGGFTVQLWYLQDASSIDVLAGFLHAALVVRALGRIGGVMSTQVSPESFNPLIFDIRDRMQRENACAKFVYGVQDKGWDIKHVFIEERKEKRIHAHR